MSVYLGIYPLVTYILLLFTTVNAMKKTMSDSPFVYYCECHEEDNVSKYISYTLHKYISYISDVELCISGLIQMVLIPWHIKCFWVYW